MARNIAAYRGCFLGMAVGDAMGYTADDMSLADIRAEFGPEGLLDNRVMVAMVILFYTWMFRILQLTYRDAAGLWTKDWLKPIIAMAIKLVFSVALVKLTQDVTGILIPTIVTLAVIYFPWEARVLYQHLFCRSWRGYLRRMLQYTALTLLGALLCYKVGALLAPGYSAAAFLIRLGLVSVIFPAVWVGCTFRTDEFRYCLTRARFMFGRRRG